MGHQDCNLWHYLMDHEFLIEQQKLHAIYRVLQEMGLPPTIDMTLTATECQQVLEQAKRYLALWEFS